MKKLIAYALLGLSFTLGTSFTTQPSQEQTEQLYNCKYDQCHATAKSTGNRCKHCVSNAGDLYCWQHK